MPIIQHSFVWVLVASIPRHPCNASVGGNSGSVGYAAFPHMWSRQQRIWRNPAGGGGWRRRVRRWRSGGGAVGGSTAGEEVNTSEEQGGAERRCRGKVRVVGWRTGDDGWCTGGTGVLVRAWCRNLCSCISTSAEFLQYPAWNSKCGSGK